MRVIETFVTSVPREKVPADAKWFAQGSVSGELLSSRSEEKPHKDGIWWVSKGTDNLSFHGVKPVASDAFETVVTREELMRAYDLVEQGYTLWFGGDCPVEKGTLVDVVYRDGEGIDQCRAAISWEEMSVKYPHPADIIAYRLSRSVDKDVAAVNRVTNARDAGMMFYDEQAEAGSPIPKLGDSIEVDSPDFGWSEAVVIAVTQGYPVVEYKGKNGIESALVHTICDDKGNRKPVKHPAFRPLPVKTIDKDVAAVNRVTNARDAVPLVELDHADTIIATAIEKRIEVTDVHGWTVKSDKICVNPETGLLAGQGDNLVIITRAQWDDYVSRKIRVGDKAKTPNGAVVEVLCVGENNSFIRDKKGFESAMRTLLLTRLSQ